MKKISKLLCLLLICSVLAVTLSVAALSDNEYEAEVSMAETNPAAVDDAADDETAPVDVTEEIVDDVLISCSSTIRIMDDSNFILLAEKPADIPDSYGWPTAIHLYVPEGENRDEYLARYTEEQLNVFRRMVGAPEVVTESKASSGLLYNDGDIVRITFQIGDIVNFIAYRVVTIYTPKGTAVQALEAMQEISDEFKALSDAYNQADYPNAQKIGDATAYYNCHAYAWYTNSVWINQTPSEFMLDGSYDEVTTPQNGDIVYYPSGHSAIITDASSMTVVSKWGVHALYSHNVSHCPYGGNVKYYRPHHDHTFKYFKTSSIYSHDWLCTSCHETGTEFHSWKQSVEGYTCTKCNFFSKTVPVMPSNIPREILERAQEFASLDEYSFRVDDSTVFCFVNGQYYFTVCQDESDAIRLVKESIAKESAESYSER